MNASELLAVADMPLVLALSFDVPSL